MTRRLLLIVSLVSATALIAQTTTRKTPTPAPTIVTVPTSAQATVTVPGQQATPPVTAETDTDLTNPRSLRLSLDDVIKTTMERNVGVSLQRYDYLMAGQSLRGSYGLFDWFTTADVQEQSTKSPTISTFQSSGGKSTIVDLGLSQLVPTGGTYTVGLNNSRATTIGGGTLVNPAYRSNLSLGATQPLLRNFGVDVTRRPINIARNTLGVNRETFRSVLMDTAVTVEQSYLDLVYTRQFVDVVKEALFLARDQARITQIRIDVGASAPLDILQPQVQIATEDEALIAAVASVRDAEDQLRMLMHLDPPDWDRPIIPTDPVGYTPVSVDTDTAVAQAITLRPELRELQLTTASRRIDYIYARNQVLPRLDLNLNYGAAGLGGTTLEVDPVTGLPTGRLSSTGFSHALNQVFGNNFPSWTVGFMVGVPVTNIGARAEAKRAEYDWAYARENEEQTRQTIAVQVRKTVRDMDTNAKEIVASRTAREAAEKNLDAERRRYENGMSTNFQVLTVQQQLSGARVSEIQALVGYNKAVSAYHRAVGDLLDVRNIQVEEPQINEPTMFSRFGGYHWVNYGNRIGTPTEIPKQ